MSSKKSCRLLYRSNTAITTYFNIAKNNIQMKLMQDNNINHRNLSKIISKVFFTIFIYYKLKLNEYIKADDDTIKFGQLGQIENDLKPGNLNDNDKKSYYYKIKEKVIKYIKKHSKDLDGILSKTNLDIMKDATKPEEFDIVYAKVTGIKQENNLEKIINKFRSRSRSRSRSNTSECHWDKVDGGRSRTKKSKNSRTKKNHGK